LFFTAIQSLLPSAVPVHHLGLYREPTTLAPVEYYNNLPHHLPASSVPSPIPEIAILIDPIIATGGTATAAIQTLLEWGVRKVVMIGVLGSDGGVRKAVAEAEDGRVEIWLGALDPECDARGMIRPGVGDLGDRLFLTIGK
jgi:uracil phosphoribosyltransferase